MKDYLTSFIKPLKIPVATSSILLLSGLTSIQSALLVMSIFLVVDFLTGTYASYVNRDKESNKRWFVSAKWRNSVIKLCVYYLATLLVYMVQETFKIKDFNFSWSDLNFDLTILTVGLCCSIEFYSIFWENLPRANINFPKKIIDTIKGLRGFEKDVEL